jgi:hypothetical protein
MIYKKLYSRYVFFVTNNLSSTFEFTDRNNLSVWKSAGVDFIYKKPTFMQKLLQKLALVKFVIYSGSLIHRGSIIKFILMTYNICSLYHTKIHCI